MSHKLKLEDSLLLHMGTDFLGKGTYRTTQGCCQLHISSYLYLDCSSPLGKKVSKPYLDTQAIHFEIWLSCSFDFFIFILDALNVEKLSPRLALLETGDLWLSRREEQLPRSSLCPCFNPKGLLRRRGASHPFTHVSLALPAACQQPC